ncbi:MAG: beta-propeller domain-containing protein [Candidatus Hadarchaeota archaeon]
MKEWMMPAAFALTICISFAVVSSGAESIGILVAVILPTAAWYLVEGRKVNGKWLVCAAMVAAIAVPSAIPLAANRNLVVANETRSDGWELLMKFSSYAELENFITTNNGVYPIYRPTPVQDALAELVVPTANIIESGSTGFQFRISDDTVSIFTDHSTTNIQVEGVDEADIVKTDGRYIYIISGNTVVILLAYPPEQARVLSRIELDGSPIEIFVNGDKLVVFEESWNSYNIGVMNSREAVAVVIPPRWGWYRQQTIIRIYNISDRENPVLIEKIELSGTYFDSRMIGGYIYVVTNMPAMLDENDVVILPAISSSKTVKSVAATEIYYFDDVPQYNTFAIIVAVDVKNAKMSEEKVILTTQANNMYVSTSNIYATYTIWEDGLEKTAVHKIPMASGKIMYRGEAEVPGRVLNQFSMDEYRGYFRIATTTGYEWDDSARNHIYVLNGDLEIVGKLENLAPTERIYSARFMGDRAYLVTFRRTDPLFVLDLSNPAAPRVLGELKIPGYSDYLHPYDSTHIIGVGRGEWGEVKIALFDVSNPENPEEISKYEVGGWGNDSYALQDHKAFLFSRAKNLLVMPIGSYRRQDAYVFHISAENGIVLKGTVSHQEDVTTNNQIIQIKYSPYWRYDPSRSVKRSLYIGNVLYTISDSMVKMNNLNDLSAINEVIA